MNTLYSMLKSEILQLKTNSGPRTIVVFMLTAVILLFSCSDSEDKRNTVLDEYGEPDTIIESEFAGLKSELYVYARRDVNRAYEFRKTAGGCGGSGQWYVYRAYYADNLYYSGIVLYTAPALSHSQVISAPPGEKIPITAEVIDNESLLTEIKLYYRTLGQEEFTVVEMPIYEGSCNSEIPSAAVTTEGIEYYIEQSYYIEIYDKTHISKIPEKKYYTIDVTEAAEKIVKGPMETTGKILLPSSLLETGKIFNNTSPVSP
ncbi:MAG: hypothetical protein HOC71_06340 [Candidatus Latescibacteria bacterium]|jgi:hypothetical protein|nr:hypothetical protein [Candidatus Latescibacterota bacterium]